MSDLTRQDRIRLNKERKGITTGEPGSNEVKEGISEFRMFFDHESGQNKVAQYIRHGSEVLKSDFTSTRFGENIRSDAATVDQYAVWHLSDEVDISSTGTYKVLNVPDNTYVMDVRILVTAVITAGSMDVDVGIGSNVDVFIDGWDGTAGSHALDTINAFGRGSAATETGVKVGKYFLNGDTIDVFIDSGNAATAGKIKLLVLLMRNPFAEP